MAGMPPQFMKNAAKGPAAPAAPSSNLFAKKKKSRGSAIEAMQKQDAMLDAKLGPNDAPDTAAAPSKGSQPPWLKGK